jgi:hypothetical protein
LFVKNEIIKETVKEKMGYQLIFTEFWPVSADRSDGLPTAHHFFVSSTATRRMRLSAYDMPAPDS